MKSRFSVEQIIRLLREAEVEVAGGRTVGQVCQRLTISEQTFYRWRQQYGGVTVEDARRLKELESENARLKKLVADLSLDKQMLQEVVRGKG
jgi:transposase-like protein